MNDGLGRSYRDEPIPEHPSGLVTAALCWWDERPEDLVACVRGIAKIADRVIALDGGYRRFPGATIASHPDQAEAIRATAAETGMECLIVTPDRLWAGQIEKRTYLYRMAALDTKWVLVVDADHLIRTERKEVRHELASLPSSVEVIAAPYYVTPNPGATPASKWHRDNVGLTFDHRLLFRSFPGLQVEGQHWLVSADRNGERIWVLHTDASGLGLPGYHLKTPYEVEHRYLFRSKARVAAIRKFLADREKLVATTGQEDPA